MSARTSFLSCAIEGREAHIARGLEDLRIDPMTGPAGFGEDRTHIPVEVDLLFLKQMPTGKGGNPAQGQTEREAAQSPPIAPLQTVQA